MPPSKAESIIIIAIAALHLIALVTTLHIAIEDETAAAVATQSAWDLFDSSGAGKTISQLSTATDKKTTQFTWQATADALIDVTRNSMPRFFGGALEDNSSVYSAADQGALGFDEIRSLHVVSQAVRLVQHRSTPRLCDHELLTVVGPSFFGFSGGGAFCPGFAGGSHQSATRAPIRCCLKDYTSTELDSESDINSFTSTNNSAPVSTTFRRVESESSVLFSGSGVASALRPDSIYYPFTGFSLDTRYSSDLRTVVLSSDGVPIADTNLNLNGDEDLDIRFRNFVDPQTRYIRLSILTIHWSSAVAVHLHVHMELPASGAGIAAWRKASSVNIRPGLFGSASSTIAQSPSASHFESSNSGAIVAEVFALLSTLVYVIFVFIRYKMYFVRDPKIPLYVNARFLLDVTTALIMTVYFILRLVVGFQTSSFADALSVANTYESTPISRSTDFISGSWTRFLESLRGGCVVMSFFITLLWPIRYLGVILQTIRRTINARTIGGMADIPEDSRTGSASFELLPAVLKRYFVDVFRLMTWCMAPMLILSALALSVLRGPDSFYYSYSGSALGTLTRDRVLNLFAAFLVNKEQNSYWSHPSSGAYWMDLILGTLIEVMVPLVFFAGLLFLGVRSCQEDVYAGKGKSAYFHHEDEEDARILQLQLFPKKPGLAAQLANSQSSDQRKMELQRLKEEKEQEEKQKQKQKENQGDLEAGLLDHEEEDEVNKNSASSNKQGEQNGDEGDDVEMTTKVPINSSNIKLANEQQEKSNAANSDEPYSWSRYGTTQQLANDAAKRKLMEQIRLLSENLRHRIGLVPPKNQQQQKDQKEQKKKSVKFATDHHAINKNTENEDPYTEYPTVRDVSREAAIERLLRARKHAAMQGRHLTAQEELSALKGQQPRNVQDAITRVTDMYEDLMTLLTAGRTIRDALIHDTQKTVEELEAEMEKVLPKKQKPEEEEMNTSNNKEEGENSSSTAVTAKEIEESEIENNTSVADPDVVVEGENETKKLNEHEEL